MGLPIHIKAVSSSAFNTVLAITCPDCKEVTTLKVRTDGLEAWLGRALIQHALPELSRDEAEMLVTGICVPCWDTMWDVGESGDRHGEEEAADFPEPRLTENGSHA